VVTGPLMMTGEDDSQRRLRTAVEIAHKGGRSVISVRVEDVERVLERIKWLENDRWEKEVFSYA
jgi:hypothetical protein